MITATLDRKLFRAFLLQMLFISVVTALAVFAAQLVLENVMLKRALQDEASHFWQQRASNPQHGLPNTDNLFGYLRNAANPQIPEPLRELSAGMHRVVMNDSKPLVFVSHQQDAWLYLIFDEENVSNLAFYFGVVPLSVLLMIIYISGWFSFKHSRKNISPIVKLADRLRSQRDNSSQQGDDIGELNLEHLKTGDHDNEINTLVDAISQYTLRIKNIVNRERRFTRDVSHELRTPLTIIQGSSEWLAKRVADNPQSAGVVERILRTTQSMSRTTQSLLWLARNTASEKTQPVLVNEMVENLVAMARTSHPHSPVSEVIIRPQQAVIIDTVPQILEIILANLIENAIKYCHQGNVFIDFDEHCLLVENAVSTEHPIDLENIFNPYYRDENSRRIDGSGLGLDIAKRLCDLAHWQIEASQNAPDRLRFKVTLHQ